MSSHRQHYRIFTKQQQNTSMKSNRSGKQTDMVAILLQRIVSAYCNIRARATDAVAASFDRWR